MAEEEEVIFVAPCGEEVEVWGYGVDKTEMTMFCSDCREYHIFKLQT